MPEFDLERGIRNHASHLTPLQQDAIRLAMTHRISVITGAAGVGKTTIIKSIVDMLKFQYIDVALCAPTGKAARRMEEVVGIKAHTIHRLLKYKPPGDWEHRILN